MSVARQSIYPGGRTLEAALGGTLRDMCRLLAAVLAVAVLLAGCGGAETGSPPTAQPPTTPAPAVTSTSPQPDQDSDGIPDSSDPYPQDPYNIAPRTVTVECDSTVYTIPAPDEGLPDFTAVWSAKADYCDGDTITPVTALEQAAYKTSRYDGNNIGTLYGICAANHPSDVYASPGFAASDEQIPEITAALMLCPKHPLAPKWRQAIQRGQRDTQLEQQGRLFGDGTFLVGKEIKAGTYVTTDVKGCYWERQNRNGGIIDNDFLISARRVQVTIRSGDYAFHSEGCKTWKPA